MARGDDRCVHAASGGIRLPDGGVDAACRGAEFLFVPGACFCEIRIFIR